MFVVSYILQIYGIILDLSTVYSSKTHLQRQSASANFRAHLSRAGGHGWDIRESFNYRIGMPEEFSLTVDVFRRSWTEFFLTVDVFRQLWADFFLFIDTV
jgi:hypothetical protein